MLAELLPAWPLIISACYHFPKASGGFKYLGDGAVYERPLRPLKTGLLGSEEETRSAPTHANIYRNSSHVAFSYLYIFSLKFSEVCMIRIQIFLVRQ